MKKVVIVVLILLAIGGFILFQKSQSTSPNTITNESTQPPTAMGVPNQDGQTYKDGVYTGTTGSASQYGDVQVKVTVSGGKITTIDVIKFPNTPGNTTKISNESLPVLKQEAITAQSAKVDNITGATQTTEGFVQSLQSALDQAKV